MTDSRDSHLPNEGTNQARSLPYRHILPVFQFIVCVAVLISLRGAILSAINDSINPQRRAGQPRSLSQPPPSASQSPADFGHQAPNSEPVFTIISRPMTREEKRQEEIHDALTAIPAALNFPVFLVEAPLSFFSSPRSGGAMTTNDRKLWRALTFPVVGLLFWWIAGRAIEALCSMRRGIIFPRLRFIEGFAGALIMVVGLSSSLVMFADKSVLTDASLGMFALGAGLWAVLGSLSTITCLVQWRRRRRVFCAVEPSASS